MTDTGKSELALTSDKLAATHAVWRELAAGRIGPKRDEVTPAKLRGVTAYTFMVDVVDGDFRFRFAGDRVIQFMGSRLAGTFLSEYLGTPFFDGMKRFFVGCVAGKRPLANGPRRATYPGKEHIEMEVLVLPLSDDGVHVTAIIGAFDTWAAGTHDSGR